MPHFARALALLALLLSATAAPAVITVLTPLAGILESDTYIFVAKADKLDPDNKDRPTATFKLDKKLKGEPPFDRIPVNMTGDDDAKKAGDTKTVFDRLDGTREVVFFVRKQGKLYNAKAFVEGSWFSLYGTLDADGKTVRWAFLHGEPFLRRTFKGTSAELVKIIEDARANKAKPPEPDDKEKGGYGLPVEKEGGKGKGEGGKDEPLSAFSSSAAFCSAFPLPPSPLFAVIPSFVLVGPLAIVAALFPGVFARMAVGMKRWRAFLTVASLNSTLALVYFAVSTYRPHWLPPGRWLAPHAVTAYLTAISVGGLLWAGRRYRRMAASEPDVTRVPGRNELYALAGLTAFAALCTVATAAFADWNSTLVMPMREFTFIGVALFVATVYAGYRTLTHAADGTEPAVRLSLSGESVGLGTLALCGLTAVLLMSGRAAPVVATGTEAGDAASDFAPRLAGEPVILEAFEVEDGKQEKAFGRVWSNLALDGDRLVFGVMVSDRGRVMSMNRHTGKAEWTVDAAGEPLLSVFCTPTVANGKVYCGEGEHKNTGCRLFCVNSSDGEPAWAKPFKTSSHTEGAPAVVGGKVYFPAGDDGLYCADAATGAKRWQFPGGKDKGIHIDAPPAVQNGTVFAGSGLYTYVAVALDADTGAEKWRTDLKLRVFGAPLASGSKVFYGVGTGNMGADTWHYDEEGEVRDKEPAGAICCLDAATGKEEWRYPLPKSVHTGVAADAFSVYAGCRDGNVYALDRATGKLRWRAGVGSAMMSAPAVAAVGGFPVAVYAVSREGRVCCLHPQTGAKLWSWEDKPLPGYNWLGRDENNIMCTPLVVTTPTATGSRRTIYIGGLRTDPNPAVRHVAVFKFEDVIGE